MLAKPPPACSPPAFEGSPDPQGSLATQASPAPSPSSPISQPGHPRSPQPHEAGAVLVERGKTRKQQQQRRGQRQQPRQARGSHVTRAIFKPCTPPAPRFFLRNCSREANGEKVRPRALRPRLPERGGCPQRMPHEGPGGAGGGLGDAAAAGHGPIRTSACPQLSPAVSLGVPGSPGLPSEHISHHSQSPLLALMQ